MSGSYQAHSLCSARLMWLPSSGVHFNDVDPVSTMFADIGNVHDLQHQEQIQEQEKEEEQAQGLRWG